MSYVCGNCEFFKQVKDREENQLLDTGRCLVHPPTPTRLRHGMSTRLVYLQPQVKAGRSRCRFWVNCMKVKE